MSWEILKLTFDALFYFAFIFVLGYYAESCMQWYSYKISRVVFHFAKPIWHAAFFALPLAMYYGIVPFCSYALYAICIVYIGTLFVWKKRLDKPLSMTARVKRFFVILFFAALFVFGLSLVFNVKAGVILPLVLALILSDLHEKILFLGFKKEARKKLDSMEKLQIIAITASFGKTSIKNFLCQILSEKFECYKTPRSVNTLSGLIKDVNTTLPKTAEIYIAEAGARERGDIKEIADFLKPDIAIVGQIGAQHIEYFKTLEAIRDTKMELISAQNLKQAFVHNSANARADKEGRVRIWGAELTKVEASLDGTRFGMMIEGSEVVFETKLLGAFNASNLAVCVLTALYLGLDIENIKRAILNMPSVEHRLQRIDAGGKIILDDSFNGNFEGMSSSYELARTHGGRRVLITPGIVESTREENEKLAHLADGIFDLIIITGSVNAALWEQTIKRADKMIVKDKSQLQKILAENTKAGDLVLFSNDAPTYM